MNSPAALQLHSTVRRSSDPVSSEVDTDLIILSFERGRYYGTEVVGKRIWNLIATPIQVDQICDTLIREFEVDRTTCEREVLAFLAQLEQEGLIQVL